MSQTTSINLKHEAIPARADVVAADKLAAVERRPRRQRTSFLPLEQVTRPTVKTEEAAFYLNRRTQTLLCWSFRDNGPIRPVRINGRLAWPVAAIKTVLGVA